MKKTTLSCMMFLLSCLCYSNGKDTEDVLSNKDLTNAFNDIIDQQNNKIGRLKRDIKAVKEKNIHIKIVLDHIPKKLGDLEKTADSQDKQLKEQEQKLKKLQKETNDLLRKLIGEKKRREKEENNPFLGNWP